MSNRGCTFNGGSCHPVIESCEGCARIVEYSGKKFCSAAPEPHSKWVRSLCNLATHVKREEIKVIEKINPLKASKRAARNKRAAG